MEGVQIRSSLFTLLREINFHLSHLEQKIVDTDVGVTPQEAVKAAEAFVATRQRAASALQDPELCGLLSTHQRAQLQMQLEISVQRMHALSRRSENLMNAIQLQYVQALQ